MPIILLERQDNMSNRIGLHNILKYSELIKAFPIHGELTDKDIIQVSHHLGDDKYETCYVTLGALKRYVNKGT